MFLDDDRDLTPGEAGQGEKRQSAWRAGYADRTSYEPWRDPTYRTAEDRSGVYSPNYHNAGSGLGGAGVYTPKDVPADAPAAAERRSGGAGMGKRLLTAACLVLICAVVSALAAYTVTRVILKNEERATVINEVVLGPQGDAEDSADAAQRTSLSGGEKSAAEIYALACEQAVGVQISSTATNIFGQTTTSAAVAGSGFIISSDGYIVTNYHVIQYAALYGPRYGYSLSVVLYDGDEYDASIIGYDEYNDIAVIKIEAQGLTPVTTGDYRSVRVGDTVYAVGNPLGELTYTMTTGIVSALDREISTEESVRINMFQIDAAVNSGNSGGPVYNTRGEVIGIVTAKYRQTGVEGLGFAIPMDDALGTVTELIEHGSVQERVRLGIQGRTVTEMQARYYGVVVGVVVRYVEAGSSAEQAGIQVGDIITALDETGVASWDELRIALRTYDVGDTARVTVFRSGTGEYQELSVTFRAGGNG